MKSIKIVKKQEPTKAQKEKQLNEEQENFRSDLIKTNDIYAKKFKSVISNHVQKQEEATIDKISASSKAYEEWLFNVKDETEALADLLLPVAIELMEAQAEEVTNFITGELLEITPELRRTVQADILRIAGVFNADTITALEATLSKGQAAGESLAKLKKRVEAVYGDAKGYRAERKARS